MLSLTSVVVIEKVCTSYDGFRITEEVRVKPLRPTRVLVPSRPHCGVEDQDLGVEQLVRLDTEVDGSRLSKVRSDICQA